MKRLVLIIPVFFFLSAGGRNDSIRQVLMNYPESKSGLISKARRLILDKFMENDIVSAMAVKQYIENELEDNEYVGMWPFEKILINFWAADYPPVLEYVAVLDSILQTNTASMKHGRSTARSPRIYPDADLLDYKLKERTRAKYDSIVNLISNASLSEEHKAFLRLLLNDISFHSYYAPSETCNKESLNKEATRFLELYPDSRYARYVGTYIRDEHVTRKWGLAFGSGSGYEIFTGELSARYTNPIPVYFDIDVEYDRLEALIRLYIGMNRTKTDMTYSGGVWGKNKQTRLYRFKFDLGYRLYDGKQFKVIPFVGISPILIEPTSEALKKDEALEELNVHSYSYDFGLSVDFKFSRSKRYTSSGVETTYTGIRLKYTYASAQLARKYRGLTGNMHSITLGIIGFGRGIKKRAFQ